MAGRHASESCRERFEYPPSFYIDAYRSYQAAAAAVRSDPLRTEDEFSTARAQLRERRARATWALAHGGLESIPFALQMLRSADVDERDDARGIFRQMGCRDQLVDSLIGSLGRTSDPEAVAAITLALGEMRNSRAIPILGSVLDSGVADARIRWLAVTSLGKLAQRRFDRSEDPEAAARVWLHSNGYRHRFVPPHGTELEQVSSTK
jgi:hypothetical protein